METRRAYNIWASQYDSNINKTRDLEGLAMRKTLNDLSFNNCLEIGCGTGKNTEWLIEKAEHMTAVDLSEEMLNIARQKVVSDRVRFEQTDIRFSWAFTDKKFDLITFSLVLEHIEDLNHIFRESAAILNPGGYIYVGELHPFKQYMGTKARFDTEKGQQVVTCFTHNISDFSQSAKENGLQLIDINEYFDDDDRSEIPRILKLLFKL